MSNRPDLIAALQQAQPPMIPGVGAGAGTPGTEGRFGLQGNPFTVDQLFGNLQAPSRGLLGVDPRSQPGGNVAGFGVGRLNSNVPQGAPLRLR
jgi:hypothetical protein